MSKRVRARRKPRRTRSGSSTLDAVARAARVSSATVSRFFNSPDMLSPRTAERVRTAVQKTSYIPNLVAGGLASSRSRLIAAAIPSVSQSIFASTIQALTDSLADEGYSVMLGLTGAADENVQRQLQSMIGRRPDGIILTGTMLDPASRKQLKATGIPTIETWDLPKDPIDLVVGFSHEAVGATVAQRALALGRRQRFDLVVCTSDWGAHGVLDELRQRGIRVPDDIAVIGFGDLEFAADLTPSLTTIKIDGAVMGKHAARFLMQRARGQKIEHPLVDIGFSLIVRESG
jgi:LacI family gluconate utilization system Gnt-I transcriptional repressor